MEGETRINTQNLTPVYLTADRTINNLSEEARHMPLDLRMKHLFIIFTAIYCKYSNKRVAEQTSCQLSII